MRTKLSDPSAACAYAHLSRKNQKGNKTSTPGCTAFYYTCQYLKFLMTIVKSDCYFCLKDVLKAARYLDMQDNMDFDAVN